MHVFFFFIRIEHEWWYVLSIVLKFTEYQININWRKIKGFSHTWRRNRKLLGSGVRPPTCVDERKAYPSVGLIGEFLLSILNVYFKEDTKPWPSCLLIDLDDICDGSAKVRHPRVYARSWCLVEINPRDAPTNWSLYEEVSCQSWESMDSRATKGVKNLLTRGARTPMLTSVAWLAP